MKLIKKIEFKKERTCDGVTETTNIFVDPEYIDKVKAEMDKPVLFTREEAKLIDRALCGCSESGFDVDAKIMAKVRKLVEPVRSTFKVIDLSGKDHFIDSLAYALKNIEVLKKRKPYKPNPERVASFSSFFSFADLDQKSKDWLKHLGYVAPISVDTLKRLGVNQEEALELCKKMYKKTPEQIAGEKAEAEALEFLNYKANAKVAKLQKAKRKQVKEAGSGRTYFQMLELATNSDYTIKTGFKKSNSTKVVCVESSYDRVISYIPVAYYNEKTLVKRVERSIKKLQNDRKQSEKK